MPAGRPRLPAKTKILQGTFQKCRNPQTEAEFLSPLGPPPAPKTLNDYGKKLWEALMPELIRSGVLTVADIPAFEILCTRYGYAKKLEDTMGPDLGAFHDEKNAKDKYIAYKTEMAAVNVMMASFGLNPSARNRFGVNKKDKPSESDEIMKRIFSNA
jgi:P27 family predicted phage terminase small subunit